jgi:flagellar basal-body rod protein FlgG
MPDAIAAATAAMLLDLEELKSVSQNFANVNTTGYKAERAAGMDPADFAVLLRSGQPLPSGDASLDPRAGTLRPTGRKLDVAIEGTAFFQVQTSAGIRYTRRGDFQLGADGVLQTAAGDAVLGAGGAMRFKSDAFEIAADGTVREKGQVMGALALATFSNSSTLVRESGGLYSAEQGQSQPAGPDARVRQGYLEAANVQPAAEMVRMMETVRHFGLAAQALRAYDQVLDASINKLGQF